jgi:hypothetical protein
MGTFSEKPPRKAMGLKEKTKSLTLNVTENVWRVQRISGEFI